MTISRRLLVLCCCCALVGFYAARELLAVDAGGLQILALVAQLGGPSAAAALCFLAAYRSKGDRPAWTSFGIGSTLYAGSNLLYATYALVGFQPSFPALPEAGYFLMAGCFAAGIFQYGKVRERVSRLQTYDFVLICCAVVMGGLFLLGQGVAKSVLGTWPTIAAFAYPALWFSVTAFTLTSLALFDQRGKRFIFSLLFAAVACEAAADLMYALSLMAGTYQQGGVTQLLWVASAGLVCWAACEHMALQRNDADEATLPLAPTIRTMTQAALPAVAIVATLVSATLSQLRVEPAYVLLATASALIFAAVIGLREHWMINVHGRLQGAAERSRAELAKTEARLESVLQSTSDSVLVLNRDWRVVYFNARAAETINRPFLLHIGVSIWELFPAAATSVEGANYRHAVETGEPAEFEIFVADRKVWLGINAYPAPDGLSIFFRDVSEQRRAREEITYMAHHDGLTGLATRGLFQERLRSAVARGKNVAIVLFDLNQFKQVNDNLGHPGGDKVLCVAAERLLLCTRPADIVARLGGDEFAVLLLEYPGIAEVEQLARRMLELVSTPMTIGGRTVRVGASAGIALSTHRNDDPDTIFKNADLALYAAKGEEGHQLRFFEPAMEQHLLLRQALSAELAGAIERNEFELAYQPIFELPSLRICSFEALLRWRHPARGLVAPDSFITLAEESGLIVAIGEWVLRTACAEARSWPPDVSVAVNLSPRQFASAELAEDIAATLRHTDLPPTRLELEITESALLSDTRSNELTLQRLRDMGIRIALDDFGTGYSSLSYLQKFQFSKLKIDRSFVAGLPDSKESQAIVDSVIGLGRSLSMRVTAEGVETSEQLNWVAAGCDEAQGFFLSRPVPADDIQRLLEGQEALKQIRMVELGATVPTRRAG